MPVSAGVGNSHFAGDTSTGGAHLGEVFVEFLPAEERGASSADLAQRWFGARMLLVVAGDVEIDPAKRDEAIAAARKVMAATREEEGCLEYTIAADLDDPARFVIVEQWASPAALEAHFATPHMAEFQAAMAGLGVRRVDVKRYDVAKEGPVRG